MSDPKPPKLEKRRIQEWLALTENGVIALTSLPSFQRSYFWNCRQSITDYLTAVFTKCPAGAFLVVRANSNSVDHPSRYTLTIEHQIRLATVLDQKAVA